MKLALECRTDLLGHVQPFADFDFCLAHKLLEDKEYLEYYKESGNIVKFVDNSVNEKGEPESIDKIIEAFKKVGGTYLVAPDYIGRAEETIKAYEEFKQRLIKEKIPVELLAGVVQGPTFEHAYECLRVYSTGIICVPYDLCSEKTDPPWLMGLRRALFISHIPRDKGYLVHLLGFNSLDEFFWYQTNPMVTSIDTGVPVLLGLQGLDILDPLPSKEQPTLNEMEKHDLNQQGWTAIIRNIGLLRKWMP